MRRVIKTICIGVDSSELGLSPSPEIRAGMQFSSPSKALGPTTRRLINTVRYHPLLAPSNFPMFPLIDFPNLVRMSLFETPIEADTTYSRRTSRQHPDFHLRSCTQLYLNHLGSFHTELWHSRRMFRTCRTVQPWHQDGHIK